MPRARRHPPRRRRRSRLPRRPRRRCASIAGQTTKPWRPSATSSARRSQTRGRQPGRSASGTTCDSMPARPAGSSRIVDTSRSPKTVIATVRGIGRGGEHEHVRRLLPLQPQRLALLDAESVLLVDDDEAEVGERDGRRRERVRADDDARLAGCGAQERLPALGGRQLAGEQRRHELAPTRSGPSMRAIDRRCWRGEHLGGREERRLPARVGDREHRAQCDDRLARADLALHEAVHRHRVAEVVARSRRRPRAGRR